MWVESWDNSYTKELLFQFLNHIPLFFLASAVHLMDYTLS